MASKDITNQQLLDVLNTRFDDLEAMVAAVGNTLGDAVDIMATSQELTGLKRELSKDFDGLELRLGRRIDAAFSMNAVKTAS